MKIQTKKSPGILAVLKPTALILTLLFSALSGSPLWAVDHRTSQERFEEAGQLYEKGSHSKALELYWQIGKERTDWKLFYNMGNCYFKLNQPVEAKIYYLKAKRLQPAEPSIDKNIAIVNKQLGNHETAPKTDFITRLMLRIESIISLDILSILLLLVFLLLNGLIFNLIRKGKGRFSIYGISFSLVIALMLAGYHIYRVDKFKQRPLGVIVQTNAELRSGPGENNTILFKVNPGLKVKIVDTNSSGDWLQVSSSEDIAGWIRKSSLQRI